MKKFKILGLLLLSVFMLTACKENTNSQPGGGQPVYSENKITITAGDTVLYATMYDNPTARNFLEVLPFTLPTIERSGLAKGVHLPESIEYESDKLTRNYKLGEIGYWPGGDIAIFYTDTLFEKTIVDVVQIGQIEAGVEVFENYSGSITIERVIASVPAYEFTTTEMKTNINGQSIYGVAYTPLEAGSSLPAIILSHGYGGNYNTNAAYAKEFASLGYFAYTFDFRGGSPSSRSDGSTLDMSVFTEEEDLKAVIRMVQSLDFIDNEKIFLFGTSQGGLVSAMAAADMEEEINGIILLYPAFVMADNAKNMYSSTDEIPDSVFFMWMTVGRTYFESLLNFNPYADVVRYTKDVLILHGNNDSIVPLSYSQRAVGEYSSAQLEVINGAGHGFSGSDFITALDFSVQYIKAHL